MRNLRLESSQGEWQALIMATVAEYEATIDVEFTHEGVYSPGIEYDLTYRRECEEVWRIERCWPAGDIDEYLEFIDRVRNLAIAEMLDGLPLARLHDEGTPGGDADV